MMENLMTSQRDPRTKMDADGLEAVEVTIIMGAS